MSEISASQLLLGRRAEVQARTRCLEGPERVRSTKRVSGMKRVKGEESEERDLDKNGKQDKKCGQRRKKA